MFGNKAREKQRQVFASQFEPDGRDYLYRYRGKAAPIQVDAMERAHFVESYSRDIAYLFWALILGMLLICGAAVTYATVAKQGQPPVAIYTATIALAVLYFFANYWAYSRPVRELSGRGVAGQALTPEEVKRRTFARITYGQLAGAVAFALFMLFRVSLRNNLLEGWNRLWLVFAAGLVAIAAVQAFRKWRFELSDKIKPHA